MQFLPVALRTAISRRWPLGHFGDVDAAEMVSEVLQIDLLSLTEMTHYFPDSIIWREKVAGLTKSLVAIA